jgi:N-acetylmuramic acid 6-phosphate etherase
MSDEPVTEDRLAASEQLDRLEVADVLATIHAEDRRAVAAVEAALPQVARAVDVLVPVLAAGGRWFNVGAGTSGRMGALDAAEIPPTFGLEPERVQAVVAGGPEAMLRSVEGAEDDGPAARAALSARGLSAADAVLAISASGRTPFALAALEAARACGARRLAITCDPRAPLAAAAEVAIVPEVGPEVIAGSTRMKGGLAQKMVLHLLSTTVMVQLGRVEGNRMTHLRPVSQKLRRRARRIVCELGGVDESRAEALLRRCGGRVADAIAEARRGES